MLLCIIFHATYLSFYASQTQLITELLLRTSINRLACLNMLTNLTHSFWTKRFVISCHNQHEYMIARIALGLPKQKGKPFEWAKYTQENFVIKCALSMETLNILCENWERLSLRHKDNQRFGNSSIILKKRLIAIRYGIG